LTWLEDLDVRALDFLVVDFLVVDFLVLDFLAAIGNLLEVKCSALWYDFSF